MENKIKEISQLLHEAGETHHIVYKIVDGDDKDWASWYSNWLLTLSKFSDILGTKPVRSELTYMLVKLDKEYVDSNTKIKWEDYYAKKLVEYFSK